MKQVDAASKRKLDLQNFIDSIKFLEDASRTTFQRGIKLEYGICAQGELRGRNTLEFEFPSVTNLPLQVVMECWPECVGDKHNPISGHPNYLYHQRARTLWTGVQLEKRQRLLQWIREFAEYLQSNLEEADWQFLFAECVRHHLEQFVHIKSRPKRSHYEIPRS